MAKNLIEGKQMADETSDSIWDRGSDLTKMGVGLEIDTELGIHTSYVAKRCRHVYTVDLSDHFRELSKRYTADDKNITRYQSNFFPMMAIIPDQSIDFAWSVAVSVPCIVTIFIDILRSFPGSLN